MGIVVETVKAFGRGWSLTAKPCDSCKSSEATLFCRADSAFLCLSCDTKIHCTSKLASCHERVWMCEACEQAPAAVTCKADAAALCVTCDADIHSANALARRHERVPVEPFFVSAESMVRPSSAFNFLVSNETTGGLDFDHHEETEAATWILPNSNFNSKFVDAPELKSGDTLFDEMHSFVDFDYPVSTAGTDSVVPVHSKPISVPVINHSTGNCFDINFCRSKLDSLCYPTQSLGQSVSSSTSLEVGVVPDGNSMSDISYSFSGIAGNDADSAVTERRGIDREARVLRYREKRKNRKFEKTIRYASRKAYAETRPRIKGRFAKRTETLSEVEHIYGSAPAVFTVEAQYGVVPSF